MPIKCLLCGYCEEPTGQSSLLHKCSWCVHKVDMLQPSQLDALVQIDRIEMKFVVWRDGEREIPSKVLVSQPALISPSIRLYIGDIDDAMELGSSNSLGVKAVVNLATEQLLRPWYSSLAGNLASANIDLLELCAQDNHTFDIISVAQRALGFIDCILKQPDGAVLIVCYGGVNRSGAVAAAYLVSKQTMSLCTAIELLRNARGTVLTNQSFVVQLVRYCFDNSLPLK